MQTQFEGRQESREWAALLGVVAVALSAAVPWLSSSLLVNSIANQILVAIPAALSIYLMLRMNLISFAAPAFMCIGGYAAGVAALGGLTNVILLTVISFIVPALVALPLGVLVLRLKGVYFVLVTYVLTEIVQLLLLEFPDWTGGSNGLAGIPSPTLLQWSLVDNHAVLSVAAAVALSATLITFAVTGVFRRQFGGIQENELLARSLGLVVWRYKALGFVVAAGLAGLAGFSLVNMLLTANPSSFSSATAVTYVAYAFVGGAGTLLGPILGTAVLVWAANYFSIGGEYSQGLFGIFVIVIVLIAPGGITGQLERLVRWFCRKRPWQHSNGAKLASTSVPGGRNVES